MLYVNIAMEIVTVLSQVKLIQLQESDVWTHSMKLAMDFKKQSILKKSRLYCAHPAFFSNAHVASSISTGGGGGHFYIFGFFSMMNIQNLLLSFQLFCCSISPRLTTQQLIAISTLSTTPVFGVGGSLIQIHSYKQIWQCMHFHEACIHVIEYNDKWPPQGKFPVWIQSESWCSPRRKVFFFFFLAHM